MKKKFLLGGFWLLVVMFISPLRAEILISAPPLYSETNMQAAFAPITRYLSENLGQVVRYEHQADLLEYAKNIRSDKYDILLSEAHIMSWSLRFQNSGGLAHTPLAKLGSTKQPVLITRNPKIDRLQSLINKRICVKPSPSLDAVQLYRQFNNPINQPLIVEIKGAYEHILTMMDKGRCTAAVINSTDIEQNTDIKVIKALGQTPGAGWSMTERLPSDIKQQLQTLFLDSTQSEHFSTLLRLFTEQNNNTPMQATSKQEYASYDKLLSQVWGW